VKKLSDFKINDVSSKNFELAMPCAMPACIELPIAGDETWRDTSRCHSTDGKQRCCWVTIEDALSLGRIVRVVIRDEQ